MPAHDIMHRRHARAAFPIPDPKAIADALADAFPNPFAEPKPKPKAEPVQTLVSVVYVTAEPTFDGPIGGYKTVGADGEELDAVTTTSQERKATPTAEPTKSQKSEEDKKTAANIAVDTSSQEKPKTTSKPTTLDTSTGLPTAIEAPKTSLSTSLTGLVAATGSATLSSHTSSPTLASSESTSSPEPTAEGMSAGGKAGLAIGILLLVGAILAIVLFVFKKKKQQAKQQRLDDEKTEAAAFSGAGGAGRAASIRTTATAPRLSLRPVTQFLPNLGEKRQSRGNALNNFAEPVAQRNIPEDQNRQNPFGNHAEAIDATNANGPAAIQVTSPTGEITMAAATAGAAVGAVGLARGASKRGNGPKPLDFTTKGAALQGPPSPAGTEFSVSSDVASTPTPSGTGAAIAAAGGPANTAVHRVQLDFKPSMDDELELRAGQLIRLLHEYDDGWALCIRLDRSKQGVVPRTCLSTRPVKPRPQQPGPRGPPPGQGQRGPQGQMRPMSPAMNGPPRGPGMNQGSRPASPSGRNSPGPQQGQRPMTPQGRPMTPQGQGRPRSPSAAQQQARRNSPPGPSPMNPLGQNEGPSQPVMGSSPPLGRKPVPGQAL